MRLSHPLGVCLLALALILLLTPGIAAPAVAEGTPPPGADNVLPAGEQPSSVKINPALKIAYRTWQQANAASMASADSAAAASQAAALGAMTGSLLEQFDFQASGPDAGARVLVQTTDEAQALQAAGIRTEAAIGDVVVAFIPFDRLEEIATLPSVVKIEASRLNQPTNDASTVDIGAPQVWANYPAGGTGSNALVAVIDTGIDPYHADFIRPDGSSRLRGMLDLSDPGDRNSDGYLDGSVYGGTEYSEAQIAAGAGSPGWAFNSPGMEYIPDNNMFGAISMIWVAQSTTTTAVAVDVMIRHSRVGDLKITLTCPSGTEVVLRDRVAGSTGTTKITATYTTTACNGQNTYANWMLRVADLAGGETGDLVHWNLHLNQTVRMTDLVGHGTHVMGTAAGNGRATGGGLPAGTFKGVAPEADLLAVRASTDFGQSFSDNDIVNSLMWVDQKAKALNRPYVANLSMGSQFGPHDGTSLVERAVDNLVGAGKPGKAVVISAGNDGDLDFHAGGQVPRGGRREIGFSVPYTYTYAAILLDIWYEGADSLGVGYRRPDGVERSQTINPGQPGVCYAPSDYAYIICIDSAANDPANGDKEIIVELYATYSYAGTWTLLLNGNTVNNGRYDGWLLGGYGAQWTSAIERRMRVAVPGTARNAVTVGAYTTKNQWLDVNHLVQTTPDQVGQYADYSGDGPTRDGRRKPEITAPGQMIASSLSAQTLSGGYNSMYGSGSNLIAQDGVHALARGTSMAAPHVTGTAALLLSLTPCLDAAQLKQALINTARGDQFATGLPNDRWGWGKLDAFAGATAVQPYARAGSASKVIVSPVGGFVTVTYGNFCTAQTMTATLTGAVTFQDGATSASRTVSGATGKAAFAVKPKDGAVVGDTFAMTIKIDSVQLDVTGEIGAPSFLPLFGK
jgi:subtilisin family serine protease